MTKQERERKLAFLKSYRWILVDIEAKRADLERRADRLYSIGSPVISDMPRGGSPVTVADRVADKVTLEDYVIPREEDRAEIRKRLIEDSIDQMRDARDRTILRLRFINGMTHEQVADMIGYSLTQERVYYNLALKNYEIPTGSD